jgi:hypothetical protein
MGSGERRLNAGNCHRGEWLQPAALIRSRDRLFALERNATTEGVVPMPVPAGTLTEPLSGKQQF